MAEPNFDGALEAEMESMLNGNPVSDFPPTLSWEKIRIVISSEISDAIAASWAGEAVNSDRRAEYVVSFIRQEMGR